MRWKKDKRTISSLEMLDGSDVVVYHVTYRRTTSAIWADRKTNPPISAEMEQLEGGLQKVLMTQFVCGPSIADAAYFLALSRRPRV
jgi:hypothetical protein